MSSAAEASMGAPHSTTARRVANAARVRHAREEINEMSSARTNHSGSIAASVLPPKPSPRAIPSRARFAFPRLSRGTHEGGRGLVRGCVCAPGSIPGSLVCARHALRVRESCAHTYAVRGVLSFCGTSIGSCLRAKSVTFFKDLASSFGMRFCFAQEPARASASPSAPTTRPVRLALLLCALRSFC